MAKKILDAEWEGWSFEDDPLDLERVTVGALERAASRHAHRVAVEAAKLIQTSLTIDDVPDRGLGIGVDTPDGYIGLVEIPSLAEFLIPKVRGWQVRGDPDGFLIWAEWLEAEARKFRAASASFFARKPARRTKRKKAESK